MPHDVIVAPAIPIKQRNRVIYATSFTVGDFMRPNFYRIDKLDAKKSSGYQRHTDERRIKRFAADVIDTWTKGALFLPTSVFLATTHGLKFKDGNIHCAIDKVGPFDVVDGQHRIESLVKAANTPGYESIKTFPIPVNIAVNLPELDQMLHFYLVNTRQKAVDAAVAQHIIARYTKESSDFGKLPNLPKDLERLVNKGVDYHALEIVKYLNTSPKSPWRNRILMEGKTPERGSNKVPQKSFVNVLKTMVLTSNHPLLVYETDMTKRMMENYWRAVVDLLVPDGKENESVVLQDNGVWFFHHISSSIFSWLVTGEDFTVGKIREKFQAAFEHMDGDAAGKVPEPNWWLVSKKKDGGGGQAGRLNRSALLDFSKEFKVAVNRARGNGSSAIKL